MLTTQISPVRIAGTIAVLHPRLRLIDRTIAHIDTEIRLNIEQFAVLQELIGPETIGLLSMPCQLQTSRSLLYWPHTIKPVIATNKITARPTQYRYPQRLQSLYNIAPEAIFITER